MEPVYFEGRGYSAGQEYDLSGAVKALGSSVEPVVKEGAVEKPEAKVEPERKDVSAAPADKW